MTDKKQMVLSALFQPNGNDAKSAWRHPNTTPANATSITHYTQMAQKLEEGMFDLFFIADTPATRTDNLEQWSSAPMFMNSLEPLTVLAAVAMGTTRIGLGATVSSSFFEPYNIARQFASLDHISGGRAAWNVVTSANDYAARNFGQDRLAPHDQRYEMAAESLAVVRAYWDTYTDDAFIWDKESGRSFKTEDFTEVVFSGNHFSVRGGLNIARPPQGHPIIIQAGASEAGKEFAAETADIVFGTGTTIESAQAFYNDLKGRLAKFGRERDSLKVISGFSATIADTEEDAHRMYAERQALVPIKSRVMALNTDLETDLFDLPLDEPVPLDRIPASSNNHQVYFAEIVRLITSGLTLREVALKFNRSVVEFIGTPEQAADYMEKWIEAGAADGFMLPFSIIPDDVTYFVDRVIPLLQERGLVKTEYAHATLRENLGLGRP
ncbi:NtaA/DmoA family FMN-dependent monooxygenase [Subtercola frigoramans]|uniref:Alkanesulfonate monooxygenase n=1 Tax=Subtercola frigoramans TaxID=120298 RepID=A0ABS2L0T8_9MICO|nr:NtaA/DmoA family FMN-dependent monooxygenase [Subtercola frigoramans]MBM7470700.1 alkanesulfonate monooxygenase [Subtercola frigoramans]